MGLITIGQQPDDGIVDGVYDLTCVGVEAKMMASQPHPQYNPTGADQPVFEWKFVFTGTEVPITGLTSQMTGPKARATRYVGVLLGPQALQPNSTYDAKDFIGKRCQGQVEHSASGFAKVKDIFPLAAALPAPGTTPAPAEAPAASPAPQAPASPVAAAAAVPQPVAATGPSIRDQAGTEDDLPF